MDINFKLKHFMELFLDWNYNSDIIDIICDYIYLKPLDKVRYYKDDTLSDYIGLIGNPEILCRCGTTHTIHNNIFRHYESECKMIRYCSNCNYYASSHEEYLQHKRNYCPTTLIKCQYCNTEKFRIDMNYHYNNCDKLFKCYVCDLFYTKDNLNLHQLFCEI